MKKEIPTKEIIDLFVEIGFSEKEASDQLTDLGTIVAAKMAKSLFSENEVPEDAAALTAKFQEKLKDPLYQKIVTSIISEVYGNYIETITSELVDDKKVVFKEKLLNYAAAQIG